MAETPELTSPTEGNQLKVLAVRYRFENYELLVNQRRLSKGADLAMHPLPRQEEWSKFMRANKPNRPRLFGLIATVAIGTLGLTGCAGGTEPDAPANVGSSGWDAVVDAANKEGAVTVYSSQAGSDEIFKQFEDDYPGIKVTVLRQPAGALVAQVDQELDAGVASADVIFHSQVPWYAQRGEQGLLAPIVVAPENEEAYRAYSGDFRAPIVRYPFLIAYNTSTGKAVKNLEDLADAASETGGTIGYLSAESSIATKNQFYTWEEAYPALFDRLMSLPHAVFGSSVPMGQSLASGEIAYAVALIPGVIPPLTEQGAPVAEVVPNEAVTGVELGAGVPANAPHPSAAQVFANWLMKPASQQVFSNVWAPMAGFLVPSGDLAFEDIEVYDSADWPQDRQDQFMADWNVMFQE
ncbi:ABC transporter substrate-binding protein [Homoserinimonas sp. A447]